MRKPVILFVFLLASLCSLAQKLAVGKLTCENAEAPMGVEKATPVLGWQLSSGGRGVMQTAYRILVADDPGLLEKGQANMWDSKQVISSQSIHLVYAGKKLVPAATYYWKVMVWDNKGNTSGWSKPASWQMGLVSNKDWNGARWIAYERIPDSLITIPAEHGKGSGKGAGVKNVLPLFRKEFSVTKPIRKASVFVCGLGHFEMSLNGKKVGDHFLDPGWTQYDKEALYVAFDVTRVLQNGNNAIGMQLGNGFYYMPRQRYRKHTGAFGFPKMILRLLITYRDGSVAEVISDDSWKTSQSPLIFSSIYGGEDYNANLEQEGWNTIRFDERDWKNAIIVDGPPTLSAQKADPVKVMDTLPAKTIRSVGDSVFVFDLGQNSSGIPFLAVSGNKGDTVRIVPGELVKDDGTVTQRATGSPFYFEYVLKGDGIEYWHPRFSYYGFRYLQVEKAVPQGCLNSANRPIIVDLKGLHTRNAAAIAGSFSCSNDLFNRTRKLIDWAIRSNMQSILTDCPHREKLGWLEQVHLMGSSIRYNYAVARLFQKILADIRTAQSDSGSIPEFTPEYVKMDFMGGIFLESPEWGSTGIILPWYLFQWYGDQQVLAENYPMMQRYQAYLQRRAKGNLLSHGLSDWYDLGPERPGLAQLTPMGLTATAIYFYDLNILGQVARLLHKPADAKRYDSLAAAVKTAFNERFFNRDSAQYGTGSQTANAMALYMNLVPAAYKEAVINNIIRDIRSRNNRITAGDIGFRYLLRVLEKEGRSDVIDAMNSRSDVPGYGYQLAKGATALTESWQALPVVSNNHLMLGHLMEWFYSGLAGIRQDTGSIAYKHIVIDPQPAGDVSFVNASYECPYGTINSSWKRKKNVFELRVRIPANTTATVLLPASGMEVIYEGNRSVTRRPAVRLGGMEKGRAKLQVGSGTYHFIVKEKKPKGVASN